MTIEDFADMGDMIDDLAEAFLIVRRASGAYDASGRFAQAGDSQDIDAFGSFSPATPNDLQRLPEGRRTDRAMRVITRTILVMEPQADVIEYNGVSWEVSHIGEFTTAEFCDAIITKKVIQ